MRKFTLSVPGLESCPEIDNLIYYLSRNHVEDFTLEMWEDEYLMPSSIFKCQELKHLRRWSCQIKTPTWFKGFSMLTSLKLIDVSVSPEALEHLISNSTLLRKLELKFVICMDLNIDSPNLRTFTFRGFSNSIVLKRVPLLGSVSILQDDTIGTIGFKFFDCFTFLVFLHLNHKIIQALAVADLKPQTALVHLKHLKLSSICFNAKDEVTFTLCLLRSCPNLKVIEIKFWYRLCHPPESMELQDFSDLWLSQLMQVKLVGLGGTTPEMELIKLLLAKSSSLQKLQIEHGKCVVDNGCKILKEVAKFRKLSKDAQVIYVG